MRNGLFLDLDGTLADSIASLQRTYLSFLLQHGIDGFDEEFQFLNGPTLPEVVDYLSQRYHLNGDAASLLTEYLRLLDTHHEDAPPNSGARELVDYAHEMGWLVCVVTSGSRSLLDKWLLRHAFVDAVDFSVCGDETFAAKPDPEPYLRALQLTNCLARDSLAIEDSGNGVLAATRAGLPTWRLCPAGTGPAGPEAGQLAHLSEAMALVSR